MTLADPPPLQYGIFQKYFFEPFPNRDFLDPFGLPQNNKEQSSCLLRSFEESQKMVCQVSYFWSCKKSVVAMVSSNRSGMGPYKVSLLFARYQSSWYLSNNILKVVEWCWVHQMYDWASRLWGFSIGKIGTSHGMGNHFLKFWIFWASKVPEVHGALGEALSQPQLWQIFKYSQGLSFYSGIYLFKFIVWKAYKTFFKWVMKQKLIFFSGSPYTLIKVFLQVELYSHGLFLGIENSMSWSS